MTRRSTNSSSPGKPASSPVSFRSARPGEGEARGALPPRLSRLHGHRVRLLAQREADRLHQDRFARPRLPRHDVQPRSERHAYVAEDGEIAYGEFDQHRGEGVTALPT